MYLKWGSVYLLLYPHVLWFLDDFFKNNAIISLRAHFNNFYTEILYWITNSTFTCWWLIIYQQTCIICLFKTHCIYFENVNNELFEPTLVYHVYFDRSWIFNAFISKFLQLRRFLIFRSTLMKHQQIKLVLLLNSNRYFSNGTT